MALVLLMGLPLLTGLLGLVLSGLLSGGTRGTSYGLLALCAAAGTPSIRLDAGGWSPEPALLVLLQSVGRPPSDPFNPILALLSFCVVGGGIMCYQRWARGSRGTPPDPE